MTTRTTLRYDSTEEHDKAAGHSPNDCDDCDPNAHETSELRNASVLYGAGCWCPVCICLHVVGGMVDDGDGRPCGRCEKGFAAVPTGAIRHIPVAQGYNQEGQPDFVYARCGAIGRVDFPFYVNHGGFALEGETITCEDCLGFLKTVKDAVAALRSK